MWDFWEDWFRRWRRNFFRDVFRDFREMNREFEEMFARMFRELPREFLRESKLPDGSIVKTWGPVVYGYSMTVGPDGKPSVKVFGNVSPELGLPNVEMKREPLVECIPGPKHVRVIVELPGVSKSDIDLKAEENRVVVSAERGDWKYYKEIELPCKVDPKSADASYTNGILEVIFRRQEKPEPKEKIEIKGPEERKEEKKEKK